GKLIVPELWQEMAAQKPFDLVAGPGFRVVVAVVALDEERNGVLEFELGRFVLPKHMPGDDLARFRAGFEERDGWIASDGDALPASPDKEHERLCAACRHAHTEAGQGVVVIGDAALLG